MSQPFSLAEVFGTFCSLLLLCPQGKAGSIQTPLPADVAINKAAGRGGHVLVTLRVGTGEELPFLVDTGTTMTILNKSLEPKLGQQLGTATFGTLHGLEKDNVYAHQISIWEMLG